MHIIFLPGFSPRNQAEMQSIVTKLEEAGHEVYSHHWLHWQEAVEGMEPSQFDPVVELSRILHELEDRQIGELTIIAKSIGTYETMWLLPKIQSNIKIQRIVLMGVPLHDLTTGDKLLFLNTLDKSGVPTYVIQNSGDSHGTAAEVKEFLGELSTEFITMEADDHNYNYPDKIVGLMSE